MGLAEQPGLDNEVLVSPALFPWAQDGGLRRAVWVSLVLPEHALLIFKRTLFPRAANQWKDFVPRHLL